MNLSRRHLLQAGAVCVAGFLAGLSGAQGTAQASIGSGHPQARIPSLPALRSRLKGRLLLPADAQFSARGTLRYLFGFRAAGCHGRGRE